MIIIFMDNLHRLVLFINKHYKNLQTNQQKTTIFAIIIYNDVTP